MQHHDEQLRAIDENQDLYLRNATLACENATLKIKLETLEEKIQAQTEQLETAMSINYKAVLRQENLRLHARIADLARELKRITRDLEEERRAKLATLKYYEQEFKRQLSLLERRYQVPTLKPGEGNTQWQDESLLQQQKNPNS
jgi:valyl-tRNA synthetase